MLKKSEPVLIPDIRVSPLLAVAMLTQYCLACIAIILIESLLVQLLLMLLLGLILLDYSRRNLLPGSSSYVRRIRQKSGDQWEIEFGNGTVAIGRLHDASVPFGQLVLAVFRVSGRVSVRVFIAPDNTDAAHRRQFRKYCIRQMRHRHGAG